MEVTISDCDLMRSVDRKDESASTDLDGWEASMKSMPSKMTIVLLSVGDSLTRAEGVRALVADVLVAATDAEEVGVVMALKVSSTAWAMSSSARDFNLVVGGVAKSCSLLEPTPYVKPSM